MLRLKLSDKTDFSITSSFIQMVHRFNSEDISLYHNKNSLAFEIILIKDKGNYFRKS